MNDYDLLVVVCNVVFVEVVCVINFDILVDVDFLWNIWYNFVLLKDYFDRLCNVFFKLLEMDFDSGESVLKF